mmetsp:Transcript_84497/g.217633  ORF Transcript_84497/g.217633 Transcript_84497/m.217633 type:complete len:232 (+) Transcript_84497:86-781(+)
MDGQKSTSCSGVPPGVALEWPSFSMLLYLGDEVHLHAAAERERRAADGDARRQRRVAEELQVARIHLRKALLGVVDQVAVRHGDGRHVRAHSVEDGGKQLQCADHFHLGPTLDDARGRVCRRRCREADGARDIDCPIVGDHRRAEGHLERQLAEDLGPVQRDPRGGRAALGDDVHRLRDPRHLDRGLDRAALPQRRHGRSHGQRRGRAAQGQREVAQRHRARAARRAQKPR